jgi:hypothetical protein
LAASNRGDWAQLKLETLSGGDSGLLGDRDQFQQLVLSADFPAALAMVPTLTFEQIDNALMLVAFDTASTSTYAFVCHWLSNRETPEGHYLASLLLSQPLCHLTDAYRMAFFHAKRAAALAPDSVDYLEYLLFFYHVPETPQLLSREAAQQVAREILAKNPASVVARKLLDN